MPAAQTTYSAAKAIGLPGMIANEERANIISRTVESAAGIEFGQPAFRGSGDHGVIVGAAFVGSSTSAAAAGNVGTSTITATPAVTAGVQIGRYVITQMVTSATGALQVSAPDGAVVGHGNVGTAITTVPGITTFTITSGGTATAGDQWYIDTVSTVPGTFVGLAVLTPAVPPAASTPDKYPQYFTGGFMTRGPMFVTAGVGGVVDGGDVYWVAASKRYNSAITGVRIPNCVFDTTGAEGDIVEVSLKNR